MKKILIVSSSSGGHIYPALTFGEELKKRGYQVKYLGIINQMEEKIIPNVILLDIPNSFKKSLSFDGIKKLCKEKKRIRSIIEEADVIIGFGGFISFVTTIVNFRKKKIFLHEQNVILGDSIKYSYLLVNKIFCAFPINPKIKNKFKYTSNPTISKIYRRTDINLTNPKIMFVFGSLSSESCLNVVKDFLLNFNLDNQCLVVTGDKFYQMFNNINKKNLIIKKKIKMSEELKNYDLVFTRGGATTLLELLKSGVEIVCIPSPYVKNNHQEKNANYLKEYINVIKEKDFTKEVIQSCIKTITRKNIYKIDVDPINSIIEEVENA